MPVPEGKITTSEIWTTPQEKPEEKNVQNSEENVQKDDK
jgi:hypothetical protein